MGNTRKILKVYKSKPTIEGAGVHLKRALGFSEAPAFDPFLLLDDFRSNEPEHYLKGFPWHPHRGIETITYVLKGIVEHGDSLDNHGSIGSGDVQWMTAGSGVIHQEMPKGDEQGVMEGFQLWANLPASNKMMGPRYRDVAADTIPTVELDSNVRVKVIAGEVEGVKGPVGEIVIEPEYLDVSMPSRTRFEHPTRSGHTVFAYVIEGRGFFCEETDPFCYEAVGSNWSDMEREPFVGNGGLVHFRDGEMVVVTTTDEPVRFLLISGKPLGEPVAWYGPIVMNTQEELETAFKEYRNGTFLK